WNRADKPAAAPVCRRFPCELPLSAIPTKGGAMSVAALSANFRQLPALFCSEFAQMRALLSLHKGNPLLKAQKSA
ncbi:MAG: hypothetical protein N2423_01665, partial [Novosphingobium sp.]|nr:hypothetical protein [Novosphingobium sp.]